MDNRNEESNKEPRLCQGRDRNSWSHMRRRRLEMDLWLSGQGRRCGTKSLLCRLLVVENIYV
jgi:hypothetical protein